MVFYKTATFHFKEGEGKAFMVSLLNDEDGIQLTKAANGYIDFKAFHDADNEDTIVFWETWESEDDFKNYLDSRVKSGYVLSIQSRLIGPPTLMSCKRFDND